MNLNYGSLKPATLKKLNERMGAAVRELFPAIPAETATPLAEAAVAIAGGGSTVAATAGVQFQQQLAAACEQQLPGDVVAQNSLSDEFRFRMKLIALEEILFEDWPPDMPRPPVPTHLIPR